MGTKDLKIAQPLTLKCGLTLPNRLVKAAMAEQIAGTNNLPDERMQAIYKRWAEGGWGMILTGSSRLPQISSQLPYTDPHPQATSTSTTPT